LTERPHITVRHGKVRLCLRTRGGHKKMWFRGKKEMGGPESAVEKKTREIIVACIRGLGIAQAPGT